MNMLHKAFAAALGAGVLLVGAGLAPIEREGDAEHQAALKEIETQPFDAAHFERLDSWTHDRPLDASIIDSKVVLLAVVSVNDPQSLLTFTTLKRYERDRGDDGLIVLAVHPESGWESVAEKVSAGRIDVQLARDVGGEFARAVRADGYPDLFLIDRAGQLRYADIENRSLKEAVNQLLGESPEEAIANARNQAQGIEPGGSEQDPEQSGASQDRAGVGGEDAETAPGVLTMPETEVPASEYAATEWPEPNPRDIFAKNFQGRRLPAPFRRGRRTVPC